MIYHPKHKISITSPDTHHCVSPPAHPNTRKASSATAFAWHVLNTALPPPPLLPPCKTSSALAAMNASVPMASLLLAFQLLHPEAVQVDLRQVTDTFGGCRGGWPAG